MDRSLGCMIRDISTPSKIPSSSMVIFPLPFSSAGVPNTFSVPPMPYFSMISFKTTPAPAPLVPMRLWPQAWPSSGRASYSHKNAKVIPGFPLLYSATKAVSREPAPRFTEKPWRSRRLHNSFCAIFSWNASSGCSKIHALTASNSSLWASASASISCFIPVISMIHSPP